MRRFAALYAALDASALAEAKLSALSAYLGDAPAADAAWAVFLLAGGRAPLSLPAALLRATASQVAGLPDWLLDLSVRTVGDLAETIAHLLPPPSHPSDLGLAEWMEQRLPPLRGAAPALQIAALCGWCDELATQQRFLLLRLLGGGNAGGAVGSRVGVDQLLVQRALAEHAGLQAQWVAQRMVGYTGARSRPSAAALAALLLPGAGEASRRGQPYPFFFAHPLQVDALSLAQQLGPAAAWLAEWQFDGLRAQVVKRDGAVWIWSVDGALVSERFPEVVAAAQPLPDGTVLDGELLVWLPGADRPSAINLLQQRLKRKTLPRRLLAELPVVFMAGDLLESCGRDCRGQPQHSRRSQLQTLRVGAPIQISPLLAAPPAAGAWPMLAELRRRSRAQGAAGLLLKHRDAAYGLGRDQAQGLWWQWRAEPLTVHAVLIYAQAGADQRAGASTDCSFAVWSRPPHDAAEAAAVVQAIGERRPPEAGALQLVLVAKSAVGLGDDEHALVAKVIRATTVEKFGPVRSLLPTLVFELGFEAISRSARHKSGITLHAPRMLGLRSDKPLHEADSLSALQAWCAATEPLPPAPPTKAG